jgi:hypothetical protein
METPLEFISKSNFLCNGGKTLCEQSRLSQVLQETLIGISFCFPECSSMGLKVYPTSLYFTLVMCTKLVSKFA